jgi:hypothetical protein
MKKALLISVLFIVAIIIFSSCSKGDSGNTGGGGSGGTRTFSCTGISPKFSTDIQPILTTVCSINSNCHAGGSTNSGGPFTNYTEVNAKRSNIRAAILSGTMPQSGTITQAQINAFICWIDGGAANN